ncbi:hypothetical protein D3C86_1693440 [compost metagenome]
MVKNGNKTNGSGKSGLSSPQSPSFAFAEALHKPKGETELKLRTQIPLSSHSRSERKKHLRKLGQNEKQNENDVKEKSITIAMLFSFVNLPQPKSNTFN